mgnify:CR=1 FL=1
MSLDFSAKDKTTHARLLARHMPEGAVWNNKYNSASNMGKLMLGLATEYFRVSILIEKVMSEIDINQTNDLILDWQKSVGIPDDCLPISGTLEDQRRDILLKLTNYGGVQTAAEFEALALLFGFNANVGNAIHNGTFALGFPIRFFDSRKSAVHTIIVDLEESRAVFALDFPIQFTSGVSGIIECLFRQLAPANCQLLFRYGVI